MRYDFRNTALVELGSQRGWGLGFILLFFFGISLLFAIVAWLVLHVSDLQDRRELAQSLAQASQAMRTSVEQQLPLRYPRHLIGPTFVSVKDKDISYRRFSYRLPYCWPGVLKHMQRRLAKDTGDLRRQPLPQHQVRVVDERRHLRWYYKEWELGSVECPDKAPAASYVIVIDDIGYDQQQFEKLLKLPVDLTFALIPHTPKAKAAAGALNLAGREYLIHLPMEPLNPTDAKGQEVLRVSMSDSAIGEFFKRAHSAVPGASGINNHMGSRFTADERGMRTLLKLLKQKRLFFLDSRTGPKAASVKLKKEFPGMVLSRNLFLDHDQAEQKVYAALQRGCRRVAQGKDTIAIGHPHAQTVSALSRFIKQSAACPIRRLSVLRW